MEVKENASLIPDDVFVDESANVSIDAPDSVVIGGAVISEEGIDYLPPPEEWQSIGRIRMALGRSHETLKREAERYREEHPEWFRKEFVGKGPREVEVIAPELSALLREKYPAVDMAPEGWMTQTALTDGLKIKEGRAKDIAERYREEHPEWFRDLKQPKSKITEHYHPDLVSAIRAEIEAIKLPPTGWMTRNSMGKELGVSQGRLEGIVKKAEEDYPDLVGLHKDTIGNTRLHYSPEFIDVIAEIIGDFEQADSEWLTLTTIAETIGISRSLASSVLVNLVREDETLVQTRLSKVGRPMQHYRQGVIDQISQEVSLIPAAPEGWQTLHACSLEFGADDKQIRDVINEYRENSPGWFKEYKDGINRAREHFSPEVVAILRDVFSKRAADTLAKNRAREEQVNLRSDIKEFLMDVGEGEAVQAQEFEELIHLFGAEKAVDILYQFRPEYRKLPVPYVKSSLTDYLGDYLVVRGEFSLEGLEKGVGLLTDPSFKDGLIEVIKADCLHVLNVAGRTNLDDVSINTVTEYVDHIRSETTMFTTQDLEDVLNEVEAYYQLLFENIHKPSSFVDQLGDNRLFPDINQRINVQEIAFKHRMLISDEMGMGKSASAIMAKEILGVKQALIVVPSNVVEVWQNYLVDYFKEGQAPSVLTVDSVEALEGIDATQYDYVIISQERLNEDYVEALGKLNYGMLIVDEMHKLKNISYGKRAECLVELAEQVSGDDEYLVLLSGTPVPNKISDVAMTLRLLYPKEFEDVSNKDLVNQIINGDMLDLRSLLVPRMQMKNLAESIEMPRMTEITETFELSPEEREIYGILVEEDELTAAEKLKILRQFILNPQLLDSTPDIISSKIQAVSGALHRTFSEKDKVVMFVNGYVEGVMRGDQTIIDQLDIPEGVDVLTIDGSIPKDQRLAIQEELKQEGRKVLLIVSGQTADVGVDFSAAQEVYFYNEPWTEYDKRQQRGRVFRPGLKEDLIVRTFVAAGTIEDGIHKYIKTKYEAVEKLLRGIPISEIEREMIRQSEKQKEEPDLEVNKDLAEYYFSSWDKMMRIYGHVKELGEEDFKKFLINYDVEYAESYANLVGSRSYQANVARLSGTLLDTFVREQKKDPAAVRILDIASGPEMLKTHIAAGLADSVISLDINRHHFDKSTGKKTVGSFTALPIADESVDYVNLSLGLHYTSFIPSKGKYERLRVFQELNRVLKTGGRGVIDMIYSLEFATDNDFRAAMDKLGLRVVEDYTGVAEHDNKFKSQVITVEKVRPCTANTKELAAEIGPQGLKAIKFKKTKVALRDSRKMVTALSLGQKALDINFNPSDQAALIEEQEVLDEMNGLKQRYGRIVAIPRDEVLSRGLARIFNGRRYVLFKRLRAGSGAVVVR